MEKPILKIETKKYRGESSVISLRMPIELTKRIDDVAIKSGRTRNEIMMLCLEFALDNLVLTKSEEEK